MTNLLRFDFNERDGVFEVIENGDWVRATDYDALAAKLAEVEANINIKADFIDATINQLAASGQRIEELEAKLAEVEAERDNRN